MSRTVPAAQLAGIGDERFFELSLDLLTVVGFDGYLKRVNPAWADLTGWTAEELTARLYGEFIHPDDRQRTLDEAARLADPAAETRDFELRFATKDGEWKWLLFSAQGNPEQQLIYALGKDITERKQAEIYRTAQTAVAGVLVGAPSVEAAMPALLREIGGAIGWEAGGFWSVDPDRDTLSCNALWTRDPERLAPFETAMRDLVLGRGEGLAGRVLAGREPVWIPDVTAVADFPRGQVAARSGLHSAIGLPVLSEGGQVMAVLDFFTSALGQPDDELTEMMGTISTQIGQFMRSKQAEEALAHTAAELRLRAEELERSNAELEQFAYVASHDLSEPLRMIAGFVRLLSDRYKGRLDADADEFIGYTIDGVERMQTLIDDLLAYSRVGRSTEARDVDLQVVFEEAKSALGATIGESGAIIEADPLPRVYGDPRELSQLLQNLLSNAIKFVPDDQPRVEVRARPLDDDMWEVSVADNGIGIEPRHADRIFKMFQRLHGRDSYPGTGIGLAICKKIVERHGGAIDVEPGEEGGSVFRVTLPASREGAG
jgi:PAS domain S-box-containing protein